MSEQHGPFGAFRFTVRIEAPDGGSAGIGVSAGASVSASIGLSAGGLSADIGASLGASLSIGLDDAQPAGGFSEVSGLDLEAEVETRRVGGKNDGEVMLLGPAKIPARLVLKRGLATSPMLWNWYRAVQQGRVQRRAVTVTLQDTTGQSVRTWTFADACPVKWTGPNLNAGSSLVGIESIELIHRGLMPDA